MIQKAITGCALWKSNWTCCYFSSGSCPSRDLVYQPVPQSIEFESPVGVRSVNHCPLSGSTAINGRPYLLSSAHVIPPTQ